MVEKETNEETTSSNGEPEEVWGTLEELLLACAVNRHGTTSWESIAKELQKRMTHSHSFAFSPKDCKRRYGHLKRRFHLSAPGAGDTDGGEVKGEDRENGGEEGEDSRDDELLRMVDELRKLRVEELKRELQRHDLSIVSLQLKVKSLEEERDKSSSQKAEHPVEASDLRIEPDGNGTKTGHKPGEPGGSSPEKFDSAEDRSFNESNSSSHNKTPGVALPEKEKERESKPKPESDPTEPVKESGSGASRPGELGESVFESKRSSGKQQQQQQSSDVQSSASLSLRKKRRRLRGDGSSGDELEPDEVSPANRRTSVKSQPLIRFLEILRSHKHGSVFQRRLPSQETEKYRSVIRQHMDLDTISSKLDKGIYNECHPKFYRDLLLVFTNAVLFYRKSSAERLAARELRKVVVNEISQRIQKPDKIRSDSDPSHPDPVVKKPRSSTTSMVVCRRRSSSAMHGVLSESVKKAKDDIDVQVDNGSAEEKTKVDLKIGDDSSKRSEKEGKNVENDKKLVTRERSTLRSGGMRLSGSNNSKKVVITKEAANKRENKAAKGNNNSKKEEASEGTNTDRKQTSLLNKKQGMANFLKRMKQNSPSSQEKTKNDEQEEEEEEEEREERGRTVSNSASKKRRGKHPKRNNNNTNSKDDDVAVARRNSTRRGESEAVATKRAGGRPPRRKVAMANSTPESKKGGRSNGTDGGDEKSRKKPRR